LRESRNKNQEARQKVLAPGSLLLNLRSKTFFDILEEVIENKRRQQIETLFGFRFRDERERKKDFGLSSLLLNL